MEAAKKKCNFRARPGEEGVRPINTGVVGKYRIKLIAVGSIAIPVDFGLSCGKRG
jgi:hypothetical protein